MGKFSVFRDKLKDAVSRIRAGRKDGAEEEKIETPPIRLSDEAMAFIRDFTAEHPERRAASEDSKNAARRIFSLFREYAGDDAVITTCRIAPFRHKSMVIAAAVSSAIIFLLIIAGLPFAAIAVSVFYLSQLRNELTKKPNRLRKFFMTSEAYNVHAVAEPEGECRNTVILTAHHDSAEIRKKDSGVRRFASSLVPLVVSFSALSAISLISLILEIAGGRLFAFNFPSLPVAVMSVLFLIPSISAVFYLKSYTGKHSPGAGDNASGLAVISTLLHYYSKERSEGRPLSSTRLVFASFDGEECGTAGSLGWFSSNTHLLSPKSYVLNFDGLYREDDMVFLARDGNGLIPLSFPLASRCSRIASSMGYHIGVGKLGFLGGETDAASAAAMGIPAVTLTSMAPGTDTPAHSEDDTYDKISEEAIAEAISIAIKLVSEIDEEDGKPSSGSYLDSGKHYKLSKY